ncbi:unnamed protein product [Ixodes pacificus]
MPPSASPRWLQPSLAAKRSQPLPRPTGSYHSVLGSRVDREPAKCSFFQPVYSLRVVECLEDVGFLPTENAPSEPCIYWSPLRPGVCSSMYKLCITFRTWRGSFFVCALFQLHPALPSLLPIQRSIDAAKTSIARRAYMCAFLLATV